MGHASYCGVLRQIWDDATWNNMMCGTAQHACSDHVQCDCVNVPLDCHTLYTCTILVIKRVLPTVLASKCKDRSQHKCFKHPLTKLSNNTDAFAISKWSPTLAIFETTAETTQAILQNWTFRHQLYTVQTTDNQTIEQYNFWQYNTTQYESGKSGTPVHLVNLYTSRSNTPPTHETSSTTRRPSNVDPPTTPRRWQMSMKTWNQSIHSTMNNATKVHSINQTVKSWLHTYLRIMSLFFKYHTSSSVLLNNNCPY